MIWGFNFLLYDKYGSDFSLYYAVQAGSNF